MHTQELSIILEWNEYGVPVIEPEPTADVNLSVREEIQAYGAVPAQPKVVSICGNASGLKALAHWLLALAHTPLDEIDHQHFDNGVAYGFFSSSDGWELLIQRC